MMPAPAERTILRLDFGMGDERRIDVTDNAAVMNLVRSWHGYVGDATRIKVAEALGIDPNNIASVHCQREIVTAQTAVRGTVASVVQSTPAAPQVPGKRFVRICTRSGEQTHTLPDYLDWLPQGVAGSITSMLLSEFHIPAADLVRAEVISPNKPPPPSVVLRPTDPQTLDVTRAPIVLTGRGTGRPSEDGAMQRVVYNTRLGQTAMVTGPGIPSGDENDSNVMNRDATGLHVRQLRDGDRYLLIAGAMDGVGHHPHAAAAARTAIEHILPSENLAEGTMSARRAIARLPKDGRGKGAGTCGSIIGVCEQHDGAFRINLGVAGDTTAVFLPMSGADMDATMEQNVGTALRELMSRRTLESHEQAAFQKYVLDVLNAGAGSANRRELRRITGRDSDTENLWEFIKRMQAKLTTTGRLTADEARHFAAAKEFVISHGWEKSFHSVWGSIEGTDTGTPDHLPLTMHDPHIAQRGDIVLAATDGLTDNIPVSQLHNIIHDIVERARAQGLRPSAGVIADAIIALAIRLAKGGRKQDNIGLVLHLVGEQPAEDAATLKAVQQICCSVIDEWIANLQKMDEHREADLQAGSAALQGHVDRYWDRYWPYITPA